MRFGLKTYLVAALVHFAVVSLLAFSLFVGTLGLYLGEQLTAFDRVTAWAVIVLTFPTRNVANALATPVDWWMQSAVAFLVVGAASLVWAAAICAALSWRRREAA